VVEGKVFLSSTSFPIVSRWWRLFKTIEIMEARECHRDDLAARAALRPVFPSCWLTVALLPACPAFPQPYHFPSDAERRLQETAMTF